MGARSNVWGAGWASGRRRLAVATVLVIGLIPAAPAWAATDTVGIQAQIDTLNQNMNNLQSQIANTNHQLQKAQAQAAYWRRMRGETQTQVDDAAAQVQQLQQQMADVQKQAQATAANLETDEQHLQTLQQRSNAGLRALDEGGTVGLFSVLLGSTNFGDFLTRFHFLQAILASEVKTMREVRAERDAVVAEQTALQSKEQQIGDLQRQAQQAITSLQDDAATYQQYDSAATAQAAELRAEIQGEEAASAQVTQQLGSLQLQYDRAVGKLTFEWPLPAPHIITSPYGYRYIKAFNVHDFHTGVDIAEPMGTPIHAAAAGVVAVAGWQGGYGNAVILYHGKQDGKDYYTLYAHQSKIAVSKGQVVQQGQVIGYVGMTGNATGPHLHFEVRINGQTVDPMPYLPPTGIVKDY